MKPDDIQAGGSGNASQASDDGRRAFVPSLDAAKFTSRRRSARITLAALTFAAALAGCNKSGDAGMALAPSAPATGASTAYATPADEVSPPPKVVAQPAPPVVASTRPSPAPAPAPAPSRYQTPSDRNVAMADAPPPVERIPQPAPVCKVCGTIETVDAVRQKGEGSGVGVVAGGVVGGLVGNQLGGGHGRDALTVLGAVGGGFAGNEAEKRIRSTTSYTVRVRMDDGRYRTFTRPTAPAVGERVRVHGNDFNIAAR